MTKQTRTENRIRRHRRIRGKLTGTAEKPRLMVFRSNKHLYAQLIDDANGATIAMTSDTKLKSKKTGDEGAKEIGKEIAAKAKEKGITSIIFDRGGYKYHGNVKAVAEEIREQGIVF